METFYQILGLLGAGLIIWYLYRSIKGNPEQFNRASLGKSTTTLGVLALVLIVFIAILALILRHT